MPDQCPYMCEDSEGCQGEQRFYRPHDVKALAMQVISDSPKHPINAIAEWVNKNTTYLSDLANFGKEDWWQLPPETVVRRFSDCEDMSLLVGSMLEAVGFETRMVVGSIPEGYHMWCEVKDSSGQWWLVETTLGMVFKMSSRAELGYEADYYISYRDGCDYFTSANPATLDSD